MVEQDAQRGGERNRDEHAQNAGPAEARDEGDDDQDRRQLHRVAHDLGVDEVEDDVGDDEVGDRDQERLDRRRGQTHEDGRHRTYEWSDVWDQRGNTRDETERDRIGQAQYPTRDTGEDSDHPGDDQLAAHIRVQHLADAAPDLVEVGAVVGGNETPQYSFDGSCIERKEKRDDESKEDLEKRRERGEADAHCVAKLTEEKFARVRVDAVGRGLDVDLETEDLDRGALQAVDTVLRRSGKARGLALQLGDLADAERNYKQNQAGQGEDDADKHHSDRRSAWQSESHQAYDAGLDQEGDGGSEDERAEEVAKEIEDDDRDRERGEAERNLQITAPPLRIERPRGDTDCG